MKADLLNTILILLAALLAVFWEGSFNLIRNLLGAQVDLLPGLMVYAGLYGSFAVVALLAVCGGLWFDSLSANPLGITVVPLFLCGLIIYLNRDLILRDQTFAQLVLGFSVSLVIPTMILLLLLTTGREPLVGWGTLWQFVVMG